MSAADDLAAILSGKRPSGGVLQNCRMEVGGGDFYGEEAILERCRAAPFDVGDADTVRGEHALALFGSETAAVADLYGEQVGRIWVIGAGKPADVEPAIRVPFDPDLRQERGGVAWDAVDHPQADAALLDRLAAAGERLIAEAAMNGPSYRVRAFLIRAWGRGNRGAGLFALHRLGPGPVRTSGFAYAAVLIDDGDERIVRDRADDATG